MSRRTIERKVRDGCFPKPVQLAPNRVGWQFEAIEKRLSDSGRQLEARAVARPEELSPDARTSEAASLIVDALSIQHGAKISPDEVATVHVSRTVTQSAFDAAEVEEFELYANRFEGFSDTRALILAAWLFASIRPYFAGNDGAPHPFLNEPATFAALGPLALHDETWADLAAQLQAQLPERS